MRGSRLQLGVEFLVPLVRDMKLQGETAQRSAGEGRSDGGQLHGREFADRAQQGYFQCGHQRLSSMPYAMFLIPGAAFTTAAAPVSRSDLGRRPEACPEEEAVDVREDTVVLHIRREGGTYECVQPGLLRAGDLVDATPGPQPDSAGASAWIPTSRPVDWPTSMR